MISYGDVVRLDTDHWETVGRTFKVLSAQYREDSTAVKLVLEDVLDEEKICLVCSSNQIEVVV